VTEPLAGLNKSPGCFVSFYSSEKKMKIICILKWQKDIAVVLFNVYVRYGLSAVLRQILYQNSVRYLVASEINREKCLITEKEK